VRSGRIRSRCRRHLPHVRPCLILSRYRGPYVQFPCVGRSPTQANQAIEAIIALETRLKETQIRLKNLDKELGSSRESSDILDIAVHSQECQQTCGRLSALIHSRRNALGVSDKAQLRRLKGNEFLQVKFNARAVKTRLRNRLRQRKFELERLERSYRQTLSGRPPTSPKPFGLSPTGFFLTREEAQHADGRLCQTPRARNFTACEVLQRPM
jgi:hypothetical protein